MKRTSPPGQGRPGPAHQQPRSPGRTLISAAAALLISLTTLSVFAPTSALADGGGDPPPLVGTGTLSLTTTIPQDAEPQAGYLDISRWSDEDDEFRPHDRFSVAIPSTFPVDLPVGTYFYEVWADGDLLEGGNSGDVLEWPTAQDSPGTFDITEKATLTRSTAFGYTARFNGSVEIPEGRDSSSFKLRLASSDDPEPRIVSLAEDGTFSAATWSGTYDISLIDLEQEFQTHSFGQITFERYKSQEAARVIPQRASAIPVTGRVLVGGEPKAGVEVAALRLVQSGQDTSAYLDEMTVTDADGRYTLRTLLSPRNYTIAAHGEGLRRTFLGDITEFWEDADVFSPEANPTELEDINAERLPVLSGRVTGPDGDFLAAGLSLYEVRGGGRRLYTTSSHEDADEEFRVTLEPGEYLIEVDPEGNNLLAQRGYFGSQFAEDAKDAGTFTLVDDDLSIDIVLPAKDTARGTVVGPDGPLKNANVSAYMWEEHNSTWQLQNKALTRADGSWNMSLPDGQPHMLRVQRNGYTTYYTGGGSVAPEADDPALFVPQGDAFDTGTVALSPRETDFATTAGQDLPWCETEALFQGEYAGRKISLPFEIDLMGEKTHKLFVQEDGVVSFKRHPDTYEVASVDDYRGKPIFAPFRAEMSSDYLEAGQITYGISPDETQVCVTWVEQVPYTDDYWDSNTHGTNTFQMIITDTSALPGRTAGDFDLRYNYDVVDWDAWGWDPADNLSWAGYSKGTGEDGTSFVLPGSDELGALRDGGPLALTAGSYRSPQPGRYNFEFRNSEEPTGAMRGQVLDAVEAPVARAHVNACLLDGSFCSSEYTLADGSWSMAGMPTGDYTVVASRGSSKIGNVFPKTDVVTLVEGSTAVVPTFVLRAPAAPVVPVTVNGAKVGESSVPTLSLREPTTLSFTGCPGVEEPTLRLVAPDGTRLLARKMTEEPSGTYTATFTPDASMSFVTVVTDVPATCGSAAVSFPVYIDPAGVVSDQWGRVIEDATVTLSRAETASEAYTVVADGSPIMSERNRSNPSLTDETGYFAWDVTPGWYKVKAEAPGCTTRTTDGLEVPPERLSLHIALTCEVAAPVATSKPTLAGDATVGSELVATGAVWAAPIEHTSLVWLRNGTPDASMTGSRYTVRAADTGVVFSIRSTGKRPSVTTDGGTATELDTMVSFESVESTSETITAKAAPKPAPEPSPTTPPATTPPATEPPVAQPPVTKPPVTKPPTKKAKATLKVTPPKAVRANKRAKVTIRVTARGVKARDLDGFVTLKVSSKGKKTRTIKVRVTNGKATVSLPRYAKGKVTIKATWSGTAKSTKATATKNVMTVKAVRRR